MVMGHRLAAVGAGVAHANNADRAELGELPEPSQPSGQSQHHINPDSKDQEYEGGAIWKWLHDEKGWLDYSPEESNRIERFYMKEGAWMMRLRAGKDHRIMPREIYFPDMMQFNPQSESQRKIGRTPPLTCAQRIRRFFYVLRFSVLTAWLNGDAQWFLPMTLERALNRRAGEQPAWDGVSDNCCGAVVGSTWFDPVNHFIIFVSAVWMAIDSSYNTQSTVATMDWGWIIMDFLFLVYFTVEIIIRWFAMPKGSKRYFWRNNWFMFDLSLVCLNILDTVIINGIIWCLTKVTRNYDDSTIAEQIAPLRYIRVLRCFRLMRLFKVVPQMLVLIKGMSAAVKSLVYTLLMLLVLTFTFAILFKSYADGGGLKGAMGGQDITSVPDAFWTLLVYGVFMDAVGPVIEQLRKESYWWLFLFCVFIFFANMTMLNMLVGILCEVITRVTGEETEAKDRQDLRRCILDLLECYDINEDNHLSRSEFEDFMENPDLQGILEDNQIDPADLMALKSVLYGDEDDALKDRSAEPKISWERFVERVFRLKGGNAAKVTDMVELRSYIRKSLKKTVLGELGTTPSEAALGLDKTVANPIPTTYKVGNVNSTTSTNHFQEQVLNEIRSLREDMGRMKSDVRGLRRRVDVRTPESGQQR